MYAKPILKMRVSESLHTNSPRSQYIVTKKQAPLPALDYRFIWGDLRVDTLGCCRVRYQNGQNLVSFSLGTSSRSCPSGPIFEIEYAEHKNTTMSRFFANRITQSWENALCVNSGPKQGQNEPSRLTRRELDAMSPNHKRFYRVFLLIHLRWLARGGTQPLPRYKTKWCCSYPFYAYKLAHH